MQVRKHWNYKHSYSQKLTFFIDKVATLFTPKYYIYDFQNISIKDINVN